MAASAAKKTASAEPVEDTAPAADAPPEPTTEDVVVAVSYDKNGNPDQSDDYRVIGEHPDHPTPEV